MTACSPPSTPAARPKSRRVRALIVATGCSKKKQQPAAVVAAAAFTLARIVGSDDLMFKILGCLTETHDLGACSCVSRRWHTLADADELWRARCTKTDPLAVALKQHPCLRQPSYKQIMAQKAKAEAVQDEAEDEDEPPAPCRSEYMIGVEVSTMVEQPSSTTDKKNEEEVARMTTEELRDHLRELKIPTGGSKFDLQSRLRQYHDGCQATDWLRPAEQQAAATKERKVLFCALRELSEVTKNKHVNRYQQSTGPEQTEDDSDSNVLAAVSDGATGEVMRIAFDDTADPGGNYQMHVEGVEAEFNLNICLIRKSDGRRLSLISRTCSEVDRSFYETQYDDGIGRRPVWYFEGEQINEETNYGWLLPGTGDSTGGDIPMQIPAARLEADIQFKFCPAPTAATAVADRTATELTNDIDAALQHPKTDLADFDGDEEKQADFQCEHEWIDLVVTGLELRIKKEEYDDYHDRTVEVRTDTVADLLRLVEQDLYACRWVGI